MTRRRNAIVTLPPRRRRPHRRGAAAPVWWRRPARAAGPARALTARCPRPLRQETRPHLLSATPPPLPRDSGFVQLSRVGEAAAALWTAQPRADIVLQYDAALL